MSGVAEKGPPPRMGRRACARLGGSGQRVSAPVLGSVGLGVVVSSIGPVDKSKNSAETRSGPSRIVNWKTEKDGIYHPLKV